MCQTMALGADKNWQNPENYDRTPLHQSIVVVSFNYIFLLLVLLYFKQFLRAL